VDAGSEREHGVLSVVASQDDRYTNTAILLHWTIAVFVIGMFGLGWWMIGLPKGEESVRAYYFNLHKSIGITVGLFVLIRVAWRLAHPAPAFPATLPNWQATAARSAHLGLYICMVLMPTSGFLSSSFSKYPVKYFGYALPKWAGESDVFKQLFSDIHYAGVIVLMTLLTIHVLGALRHLLLDKGVMFRRMWPRTWPALLGELRGASAGAISLRRDSSVPPPR
jgi:cytochrome b561